MISRYYSHGKLLITSEYLVLDGALALAVPTKFGQSMEVEGIGENEIVWTALDHQNKEWFHSRFKLEKDKLLLQSPLNTLLEEEKKLQQILAAANELKPGVFKNGKGFKITTKLDFPQNWGLGSSSTLISNIAQWLEIDPYQLLDKTFGGSGYDIAAALNDHPITYQRTGDLRSVLISNFNPAFKDRLFFVHLNKKQNSRASISHYRNQPAAFLEETIDKVSAVTQSIISCTSPEEFELLLEIHETLISKIIKTPKIKHSLFPDFPGAIKSLGGWGGDFILATGGEAAQEYFREKGYETILSYREMVI